MTAQTLFYIIIGIIIVNFFKDKLLDAINSKHYNDPIPEELKDVYDAEDYKKSQAYKATNYKFGVWSSLFSTPNTTQATSIRCSVPGFNLPKQTFA
mgnify:CR=1 FL=1